MSDPDTGLFIAKSLISDAEFRFDGETWSANDKRFDLCVKLLNDKIPFYTGTHITVPEAGRDIMNASYGDTWEEVYARAGEFDFDLPEFD